MLNSVQKISKHQFINLLIKVINSIHFGKKKKSIDDLYPSIHARNNLFLFLFFLLLQQ
jgi:hypothetical protein